MKMQKFKYGDLVELINTGTEYDGKRVKVVGVASVHYDTVFYILEFDKIMKNDDGTEYHAIQMIDSCLRLVGADKVT